MTKFTVVITPRLLGCLGPCEVLESRLLGVVQHTLWAETLPINQERDIRVKLVEICTIDIELELNQRSAEIVKDMIHEGLYVFFNPEYNSDIEVEINNEL